MKALTLPAVRHRAHCGTGPAPILVHKAGVRVALVLIALPPVAFAQSGSVSLPALPFSSADSRSPSGSRTLVLRF